jgi:hypothetical protein
MLAAKKLAAKTKKPRTFLCGAWVVVLFKKEKD